MRLAVVLIIGTSLSVRGAGAFAPPPSSSPATKPETRQNGPLTPEALGVNAAKAREAGRLDEAELLYRQALKQRPSWLEGRWALATLLYDTDRFPEARRQFDRIVIARPTEGQALALRALCDARLGAREAALEGLLRARKMGITSPEVASVVTFQTAVLLNRLGDPDAAFETLRPFAIDADDRPAVIEAFGLIVLRLPFTPEELPAEKREMVLLAGRGGYHMARARRSDLGRMALEELVSRHPAEPNVHYALGMYLLQEDPAEAIEEFRRELTVSPDHSVAMIQIALAELRRGRGAEAVPVAEGAVRLTPRVPAARLVLGRALLAVGQTDRAVSEMEAAVKLAPENPRVRFALAQAYAQAGRPEDAARERSEFLRLNKASGVDSGIEPEASPSPTP